MYKRHKAKTEGLPKLVAVVGPTASGKTDLAISLCRKFKGEVISADSRQFYRGMRIGAAIPDGKWRTVRGRRAYYVDGVPHHLMSFRSPAKPLTAAIFRRMAMRKAREIAGRGHVPFLVGGTGLYISAVVDNFDIPKAPPDPAFRARMEKRSTSDLWKELKKKDSEYCARISSRNRRYIIRALEATHATGKPFSASRRTQKPVFDVLQIGITRPREQLYRRIDCRVDRMMEEGLLAEARRLGKRYGWNIPTMSSLGHRQLGEFLRGEVTLSEAWRLIKRDTRHYAKRQMTWFRRDKRIKWVKGVAQAEKEVKRFLK